MMKTDDSTQQQSRDPNAKHVDVLVIGGGPAGVGAAFAAARLGAKVLVVEQFNCLGGVGTAAGHGHMSILSEEDIARANPPTPATA